LQLTAVNSLIKCLGSFTLIGQGHMKVKVGILHEQWALF